MELNHLKNGCNQNPTERLSFLESNLSWVLTQNDLYLERIVLYNFIGQHEEAYRLLSEKKFQHEDGGIGEVSAQYVYTLVEIAKKKIIEGDYDEAIHQLKSAQYYPENLRVENQLNDKGNEIWYHLGCAYNYLGKDDTAKFYFDRATQELNEPSANDQHPDKIFYQGLAYHKLGEKHKAKKIFENLLSYGKTYLENKTYIEDFAFSVDTSLTFDIDLDFTNEVNCLFMIGLAYLGLENLTLAKEGFLRALSLDPKHLGAQTQLRNLEDIISN